MHLLIAGCGDLGRRLGLRWIGLGGRVTALRRDPRALPAQFDSRAVDLCAPLPTALLPDDVDAIAWLATPDQRTPDAYRRIYIDAPRRLIDALPGAVPRVLLASSTAVYGEDRGGWVDEDTVATPRRFNGELLLEAESRLQQDLPQASVARLSGLYGPGRDRMWQRARAGEPGAPRWGNRIHADDAADALLLLLRHARPPACVCISDDRPARDDRVLADLRRLLGLPPVQDQAAAAVESGKRVGNARLRGLGALLRYPDHLAGYAALASTQPDAAALL